MPADSWVQTLVDRAMTMQGPLLDSFSKALKDDAYGRVAELIVEGPEGGIFRLCFTERGLAPSPDNLPIRNRIWLAETTLLDLITPDISPEGLADLIGRESSVEAVLDQLHPRLEVGSALARRMVIISGEILEGKTLYDTGEIASAFTQVVRRIFFPLAVRALMKKGRKR